MFVVNNLNSVKWNLIQSGKYTFIRKDNESNTTRNRKYEYFTQI